jgi:glycosyltransferase involved in cell wall biosynthesis
MLRAHESAFDIFHVEGQFTYGAGLYRLLGGMIPVVAFCNREMPIWTKVQGFFASIKRELRILLEKTFGALLAQRINHYIFTNPVLAQEYRAFGYLAPYTILPDFVNPEDMRSKSMTPAPSPTNRGIEKQVYTLFASGRMIVGKGFHILIEALSYLSDPSRVHLVLSGDGPERERLIMLAESKGVSEQVSFPGWVSEKDLIINIQAADIFVLPAWRADLTSVLLLESLVFATPAIVPKDTALAWVAGKGARHFAEGDPHDLARTIEELVTTPSLRIKLSEGAIERITELEYRTMARTLESNMLSLVKS